MEDKFVAFKASNPDCFVLASNPDRTAFVLLGNLESMPSDTAEKFASWDKVDYEVTAVHENDLVDIRCSNGVIFKRIKPFKNAG